MNKFIVIFLACFIASCSPGNNALKKLEGRWEASGSQDEEHSWFIEYNFKGDTYTKSGYPPLSEKGKIKLKEGTGDSLLITFIVEKSDPAYENHDEWIVIKENSLKINSKYFTRSAEADFK